uniref:Uncharacterized protein n=1 Tax=Anguilla anguilla TaxID=7936 RepID=A0A0E9WKJ4_ANGAN
MYDTMHIFLKISAEACFWNIPHKVSQGDNRSQTKPSATAGNCRF